MKLNILHNIQVKLCSILHGTYIQIVVIECFVQYTILWVKLVHLIYDTVIQNAEDYSHF